MAVGVPCFDHTHSADQVQKVASIHPIYPGGTILILTPLSILIFTFFILFYFILLFIIIYYYLFIYLFIF
jgi:hypothetical protein